LVKDSQFKVVFCCIPNIHEHPIGLLCWQDNRHLNITVYFILFKKIHLGIVYTADKVKLIARSTWRPTDEMS